MYLQVYHLTLLIQLGVIWTTVSPYKILMLPSDQASHVNFFSVAAKALSEAGHDVQVLTVVKHRKTVESHKVKGLYHEPITSVSFQDTEEYRESMRAISMGTGPWLGPLTMFKRISEFLLIQFDEIMENKELMLTIERYGFDLAIVDGLNFARLNYIIPYKFGIPYITLTALNDPWAARVPSMPSFEPLLLIKVTNRMSFFQRCKNLIAQILITNLGTGESFYPVDVIQKYAPEKPITTYTQLVRKSALFLVNIDIYGLDYPRVSMPHFIFIGGLGNEDAKLLPKNFETFVQGAEEGVIVMSFGSVIKDCSVATIAKFFNGFRRVKQRVIMSMDGKFPQSPPNVLVSKWIPQNDLLGHSKTKLFITHGGNNGQMEAFYHGVPMIILPFNGDQFYNGERAVVKGFAKVLSLKSFTEDELVGTINEVIGNESYKLTIQRASKIVKSLPSPQKRLVYWSEHVIKYGASHLRSYALDMPAYQYFMIDIFIFVLSVVFLSIIVTCLVLKILFRKCCKLLCKAEKEKTL